MFFFLFFFLFLLLFFFFVFFFVLFFLFCLFSNSSKFGTTAAGVFSFLFFPSQKKTSELL